MRLRVRQSKSSSLVNVIAGAVFVCIGVFFVIPMTSEGGMAWFGFVWTGIAALGVVRGVLNLSTDRGVADEVIDVDRKTADSILTSTSVEDRLRKLNGLHASGLISEVELKTRREEILKEV